jgi:hypothetical protein
LSETLQLKIARACDKKFAELRDFMLIGSFSSSDALWRALGPAVQPAYREQSIRALNRSQLKGEEL